MAYYSKYTGAELEERLDKVEEIPQLIAQMITGKDFVTKEDLLCVLKDYAPADYRTIPIDNNTIYWENGVLKAATSEGGQCQWELREHNGIQYLYSRLPVVTQYDVTMYADVNHLDLPSIYDGLPIDGDTIYWEETEDGKVLKAKSVGGSGENIDAGWVISVISNAGFATQNWVNSQNFISSSLLYTELAKYVKIKDYQEIEGVKNFLNGLQIAGLPITKLNGYEDVIYIDANVVVRGGLTMYYEEGEIDLPTIKDEIGNAGYDGVTGLASFNSSQFFISNDGTVTIIGGSTGLDTAQLKEYLDSNKYTTETWVKEQSYASASSLSSLQTKVNNFLEGSDTDTIINKWKELEVFLSGLSESDNLATILSTKWTTDNSLINKWNTAYGWGNHASVGYALKSYVDDTFVTIKGNEDVTGVHDFVNGLKIGNIKLSKSQEGVVYLEGNLVVKGGVTMYALDEVTVDSILDSLPIASTSSAGIASFDSTYFSVNASGKVTLTSAPSMVSILGSLQDVSPSVSGTTNSDVVLFKSANSSTWTTKPLSEIGGNGGSVSGNYLPLNNTSIPIVLNTQARVVNFKSSNAYEVGIGLIRGNTDKGSLYASNSSIGIYNKVKDTAFYLKDDGGLKYEINGVEHDVLNAGNYSSYALPLSGGTLTGKVITWSDLIHVYASSGSANAYISYYSNDGSTYYGDLGFYNDGSPAIWTSSTKWKKLIHEGNISSYNAGSATKLQTARTIWGQSFDGTSDVSGSLVIDNPYITWGSLRVGGRSYFGDWVYLFDNSSNTSNNNSSRLYFAASGYDKGVFLQGINVASYGRKRLGVFVNNEESYNATTWNEALSVLPSGNVGIGTPSPSEKLQVEGNCWLKNGRLCALYASFDGISSITDRVNYNAARIGTFDRTEGGFVIQLGKHDVSNAAWRQQFSIINSGWTETLFSVDRSGNVTANGGITMYSDIRKKTKLQDVELSLSQIANAPLIQHYYNSDQNKTTHVGSIAQYWAGLNDWFCKLDNEGYYTMEIQNCALASAISIARHLEKYESKTDKKIRQLKKRISQLEDELELLKKGV